MRWSYWHAYSLGVNAAWADLRAREGPDQVARLIGLGMWAGLPRTSLFFAGYRRVLDLPPRERWRFVVQIRQLSDVAPGARGPGHSSTDSSVSDSSSGV